jgi:hypothetical protein
VLSAAKANDNTQLFKSPTTYEAVLTLITNSEYSQGLINVAAELTAANIIRSLPLNDSLKLIDRGNALENRAYSNLDRIIFLYISNTANASINSSNSGNTEYFFFAPAIDRSTIPTTAFDVGLETDVVDLLNVSATRTLTVNPNELSFIYFNVLKSEPGTPPLLNEGATLVVDGETIESLVFRFSSDINDLCTNVYSSGTSTFPFSNLISAPTRTINRDISLSIKKKDLYPEATTFRTKVANSLVNLYSVYIEFSARRLSTVVATEAVIVRPITIHKASLFPTYKNQYNIATNYIIGDIVILNNIAYVALQNNTNVSPIANSLIWALQDISNIVVTTPQLTGKKNSFLRDSIDGLLVGKQNNIALVYSTMQAQGPLSTIIDVNRGVTSSAAALASSNTKIDHKIEIDTFYFSFSDPAFPFCTTAGRMFFRISTLSTDVPWVGIDILVGDTPADVAFKLVQRLLEYRVASDTHVVGAQIYNNAVYINAYKITNPEVKVVVDIRFEDVVGITIAAYYYLQPPNTTAYNVSPRSVAVTTVLRITNNVSSTQGVNRGASLISLGNRSNSKMIRAIDKIATLNSLAGN